MTKLQRAIIFATEAHRGQKRKFSDLDYITHPLEVSNIIRNFGGDENQQCAGVLHDVVEDCDHTIEDIINEFGEDVAYLVHAMTKTYDDNATGAEKSASECQRFTQINDPRILLIKCADMLSNLCSVTQTPDSFRIGFVKGKRALFDVIEPKFEHIIIDALYMEFEVL